MSDEEMKDSPFEERRSSQRIPVEMWVEESTDRELYFQRGANISVGGIFLERTIPHARGTIVTLQFTLPDEAVPIRVKGEIVNIGEATTELGMGIKFLDLAPSAGERIETFIQKASSKKA